MELAPGITAAMPWYLHMLSGRTPLFRSKEFFQEKDVELIPGQNVLSALFCGCNVGRLLDKVQKTSPQKFFSQFAGNAIGMFDVDPRRAHFDTTSFSAFGDYDFADPPLKTTHGHSKDKRPDLNQFLISMLCIDRNTPIMGIPGDGNALDKTLDNELLDGISRHMARHGLKLGVFVYVAHSVFATPDNLQKAKDNGLKFITRLQAPCKKCGRAIADTVSADNW